MTVAILFVTLTTSCFAGDQVPTSAAPRAILYVTPAGPDDGGDFGPRTPGTKTSGLQEAFNAAKAQARDIYIVGGSWTANKTEPVVYFLDATLHIPWMQNFRVDGGHYVINYNPREGDAVVIDSQMSCAYRFGLIVSNSSGAVVRMKPTSAGPDGFRVITSTEFTINALVGGGGAWPGGEAGNSQLKPDHDWKGVGLWLDAEQGSIDANKITIHETVGCQTGLLLSGAATRNTIEEINIHLCREHLVVGGPNDAIPADNRIDAFLHSQGITPSTGARIFGKDNMLTLSVSGMSPGQGVILEASAMGNWIQIHRLDGGVTHRALSATNRVVAPPSIPLPVQTPDLPASGLTAVNRNLTPVAVQFLSPGLVRRVWTLSPGEEPVNIDGPMTAGTMFLLNPGDEVGVDYERPPTWTWKAIR
jgi:hypothetical protein